MVRPRAWLLNFDADEELARPAGYTPSAAVAARSRALAARVGPLLGPGDLLLEDSGIVMGGGAAGHEGPPLGPGEVLPERPATGSAVGRVGLAWCPTPRALRVLRKAGAEPAPGPGMEILRRVNHRRFCAELGQTLPGARFVETMAELEATVAGASPTGQWLLKRPFGFAGRGRLKIAAGALDAAARSWAAAALATRATQVTQATQATRASQMTRATQATQATRDGLQVEPWVERRGDFSQHGFVDRGGVVVIGAACAQVCDARGAWGETRRAVAGELDREEEATLAAAAREAGQALAAVGYFGPFGIDAFRWEDAGGTVRFNARCEINARYTMGWAAGMGELRPDLA